MEVILFNFIIVIATGKNEINKIKKMKQDPNSICKGLWVIYMCIHAANKHVNILFNSICE